MTNSTAQGPCDVHAHFTCIVCIEHAQLASHTVQYSIVQRNATQHSTAQHSTAQHRTVNLYWNSTLCTGVG
ncbi:hypothetical protein BCV70DRAFT_198319 [Testicularia cyperi]|uniref:Uncharacterized protein n=1 Tax=Testicularia cyperi TaxID=1882483 RepID=A0A317XXK3_9BASI|nr:hypothetical protein BCV70DRAFT_198319 [Testicularia cyperi]